MKKGNYPLYDVPEIHNLRELIEEHSVDKAEQTAFTFRKGKKIEKKTYSEFRQEVECLGEFFLQKYENDHIAVFGENSYYWLLTYFAVACSGNVIVPIDAGLSADEVFDLVRKSDCKAIVYSAIYSDIVEEIEAKYSPDFDKYSMKEIPNYLNKGIELLKNDTAKYKKVILKENQTATIVFTSGTTGVSKGVVLTHENLCQDIYAACQTFTAGGPVVVFLPFHHIFGLIAGVMMVYHYAYPIHINNSLKNIMKDIQEIKPQMLMLVPLYIESFYKQIMDGIKKQHKEKQFQLLQKIISFADKLGIDLRKKILGEIQEKFGGNLEYIICGGAALDSFYIKQFRIFGIELRNGYGITECSSVISVNRNKYNRDGSVGQVIPCCEVKIADDGEILVRGANVMREYYKDTNNTKKSFTDGWYHTGDIGYMDKDDFLYVNGRSKNLIILSNGENVSPEGIEQELLQSEAIEEIVVRGDKNYLVAEIFPKQDLSSDTAEESVHQAVEKWNEKQPKYRQIQKVVLRDEEFEKTTSRKIKRG
jgi:long-chain acyl-CoA synthetase